MNRIESTSYSVLITRGISRYQPTYRRNNRRCTQELIQLTTEISGYGDPGNFNALSDLTTWSEGRQNG